MKLWNRFKRLFRKPAKRTVRASRSKLILNSEEGRFAYLIGYEQMSVGRAGAAVEIRTESARRWAAKPKIKAAVEKHHADALSGLKERLECGVLIASGQIPLERHPVIEYKVLDPPSESSSHEE